MLGMWCKVLDQLLSKDANSGGSVSILPWHMQLPTASPTADSSSPANITAEQLCYWVMKPEGLPSQKGANSCRGTVSHMRVSLGLF